MASYYRINVFTKLEAHREGVVWPEFSELNRPHLGEMVTGLIVPKVKDEEIGRVTLKVVSVVHSVTGKWTSDMTHVIEVELA